MERFKIPTQIALGARLKEARLNTGRTQADIATSLGRPQSYVAKLESGEHGLSAVDLVYLAAALGLEPSVLLEQVLDVLGYREGGNFKRVALPRVAKPKARKRTGAGAP